ncbi:hypothetical protein Q3G72_010490 [Acer saccharum]|nr:hypothetical protein Q3G72_010490 [Acer saccharum]
MYPQNECDIYGRCGSFGRCEANRKPICSCLRGFEPKNLEAWKGGNWTGGCIRRTPLQCGIVNKTNGEANKEDGFLKLGMIKVPDFAERTSAPEEKCREICLSNCSCIAYAYDVGIGCMSWRDNLTDVQQFYNKGTDFYVRVAPSELAADKKDMKVAIIVPVVIGTVAIAICAFFLWRWMAKRKAMKEKQNTIQREEGSRNFSGANQNKDTLQDLPLFDFEKLATATDNFHSSNKLGEGGFGPVYKGILEDGQVDQNKEIGLMGRVNGCCLRGFEPKNIEEWNRGNWTSGCVRSTALQCESINKTGEANKEDGFLKMEKVKVPDFAERTYDTEDKCREFCLSNCSCIAYAYAVGIGCMQWRENLTDIQQFYSKGTDFYIRLAHSELDKGEYFRLD